MELSETKELHDLLGLGGKLVDTSGTDNESDLGLSLDVEVAGLLGGALGVNVSLVSFCVLLGVGGSVLGGGGAGSNTCLLGGGALVSKHLHELSVSLLFLENILGDCSGPKTKHKHTCEYDVSQPP